MAQGSRFVDPQFNSGGLFDPRKPRMPFPEPQEGVPYVQGTDGLGGCTGCGGLGALGQFDYCSLDQNLQSPHPVTGQKKPNWTLCAEQRAAEQQNRPFGAPAKSSAKSYMDTLLKARIGLNPAAALTKDTLLNKKLLGAQSGAAQIARAGTKVFDANVAPSPGAIAPGMEAGVAGGVNKALIFGGIAIVGILGIAIYMRNK